MYNNVNLVIYLYILKINIVYIIDNDLLSPYLFIVGSCLGNQEYTRCLGNYLIKGAYKEFEDLAPATSEPVIAVADITGGIELDESCR